MKSNLLLLLFLSALCAHAQGTALTYQGRLNDAAGPASGKHDFQFTVRDALTDGNAVGVNPLAATLTVSNGLFTVTLDPGAGVFTGADRWLEIAVRPTGDPLFTTLSPRQKITATPYAITAGTVTGGVTASQVTGTIPLAQLPPVLVTNGASGVNLAGTFTGGGTGLTGLNASQLTVGTVPVAALGNAWKTTGNAGTTPGTQFLGTTDNQPLELQVNGGRALRLEPTAGGFPNLIGGVNNTVGAGTVGATIAGGGFNNIGTNSHSGAIGGGGFNNIAASSSYATIAGGVFNNIGTNSVYSAICGGNDNNIADNSDSATIAGGYLNNISNYSWRATIAGGVANRIGTNSHHGAIGGGWGNRIADNSTEATIAGGYFNDIGTNSSRSAIGGGDDNNIASNSDYATIAGGYLNDIGVSSASSAIGGGYYNKIADNSFGATIAGGYFNDIGANSRQSTIGGGSDNDIAANSIYATIAGGWSNDIGTNSTSCAIGGGENNNIADNSAHATIAGGWRNNIGTNSGRSAIGGGFDNYIAHNSSYATIPGGDSNSATNYAFAAGRRAKANHQGAFVWGDSTAADIASAATNSVSMRASGGYYFYSNAGLTAGVTVAPGSGSWASLSDRQAKENFAPVDAREVLQKVAALPLTTWNYKSQEDDIRHLGVMAQDFHAAFGLNGPDDRQIATVDADGVALAAIQGLNQKVEERETSLRAELKRREAENAELKRELAELSKLVKSMNQQLNGGAR